MKKQTINFSILCALLSGVTMPSLITNPTAVYASPQSQQDLVKWFKEAADEYNVPLELLISIGWVESRLNDHDGEPNNINGYGFMNLVSNPERKTLEEASEITGISIDELKTSTQSNIKGGAAILSKYQQEITENKDNSKDYKDWLEAVKLYSGADSDDISTSYAEDVFSLIENDLIDLSSEELVKPSQVDVDEYQIMAGPPELDIKWVPAHKSNYDSTKRSAKDITHLVIHVMQGTYTGSISWAQKNHGSKGASSAHYYVSDDGDITQMVDDRHIAYHARSANPYTIGIEHEGYVDEPKWFTNIMYRESAKLAAMLAYTYDIPVNRKHIKGHSEYPNQTHTDPGKYWDWDYYMKKVKVYYDKFEDDGRY
ncbi:N-acetylmuramoyl-L-alanine amidase [Brevibacillus laterosporus]|uniref:N-acetylmuramoyl-L-alanine amidase n=1 Tax=Brevibacillus laterosporus LMG 15441 TaxID=1042163 RepID=A0A075RB47_BRELA|nr:N-acetylmuramoyl-L-alanine amidase [Brevibacillus laterosporus]AIG28453.1 N-acetylmuramoyl-L-alanine amidase A [Brevibacillus laterosporus LMG 15441]ERM17885.1 N-acetylmuramoyl-L-alanine amidase [Brevibacillus laterosporus PE36]RJL13521.1 N-acetylmuramoyl-L-alanine amidase [Brevibacillus laterosporus]TPH17910.1 N-acetylmuramoyl-L-alanine amidase [Brevibacillus laterosporus]